MAQTLSEGEKVTISKICPKCDGYVGLIAEYHKCPPIFKVRPSYEEDAEQSANVYADNIVQAAEKYYERRFADYDFATQIELIVVSPGGVSYLVDVRVESVPQFTAEVKDILDNGKEKE